MHYIWKASFGRRSLVTVSGEKVNILETGEHNRDAGPDFFNAMVRIGATTWAGSVEVHVKASDWKRHGHHQDAAYDNVILHAVYDYDTPVFRTDGGEIPAIVMKEHIPGRAYRAYLDFLNNHLWIPCAHEIGRVPAVTAQQCLEDLCMDRILHRAARIRQVLDDNHGDWNHAFFISLAGSIGTRVNKEPFEMLARSIPVAALLKSRHSPVLLEAMLFGQAGFLSGTLQEEHPLTLAREYLHLKRKYSLQGIPPQTWKFLRLRPVNFPTVRIAQLAAICHTCPLPLGILVDEEDPVKWRELFNVKASVYWDDHYHFNRVSVRSEKWIGQDTTDLIMINTVIPFLYSFGMAHDNAPLMDKALGALRLLPAESNGTMRTFSTFGLEMLHAGHSQGALELKKSWCDQRKCLDCRIGHELLKESL